MVNVDVNSFSWGGVVLTPPSLSGNCGFTSKFINSTLAMADEMKNRDGRVFWCLSKRLLKPLSYASRLEIQREANANSSDSNSLVHAPIVENELTEHWRRTTRILFPTDRDFPTNSAA
jgi:hypothetical protein